jgi:hypothetical protein
MNTASSWRQAIARDIAPLYADNPAVAAVIVGGSSARGHADQYSDIELGVFWHTPPTDAERQIVVDRAGADLVALYPYDAHEEVWCDDYMIGRAAPDAPKSGILIEAVHYTTDFMNRVLEQVLEHHNPEELQQNLIAGVLDAVPAHGSALIQQWQNRARHYPESLAMAVVNRHATIDHFWRWEMWLQRHQNLMLLYQSFSHVEQKLLHVLLGLNRVYYFGFKWLDVVAERLPLAPPDLVQRLAQVYQVEPAEGAHQLAALVEETYDLVEKHMPTVDVDWLRRVFRYRRPIWSEQPPSKHG